MKYFIVFLAFAAQFSLVFSLPKKSTAPSNEMTMDKNQTHFNHIWSVSGKLILAAKKATTATPPDEDTLSLAMELKQDLLYFNQYSKEMFSANTDVSKIYYEYLFDLHGAFNHISHNELRFFLDLNRVVNTAEIMLRKFLAAELPSANNEVANHEKKMHNQLNQLNSN